MFLHIGNDFIINTKDIIGIFDMDNTTVSRLGRSFLNHAQKAGRIVNTTDDLPKSYIIAGTGEDIRVYISPISPRALRKRAGINRLM